ncbi:MULTISPECIES: ribbon-helix-helix domain-containing protein [Nocardia]|uniref:ribbon-helix-helix domain-containing protein n=1 Tax=Nocardia TaxID=1817 RepID=UPI00142E5F77|nr:MULTISPECIES: ribbon-helix-helix domain-containing protein [Nocardia]
MATTQLTITVDEELAATVRRAAETSGQSISGFAAAALRLRLIAMDTGTTPVAAHTRSCDSLAYNDVVALLALPCDESTG